MTLLPPPASTTGRTQRVREIASGHLGRRGPLLPILHGVTDDLGHLEREDIETIADVLNLSRAEVHGVVSFYSDFRRSPAPAHAVTLCRAEACQAVGAEGLYADTEATFAGRADVEVSHVFCLGNCALGPSGTVDGRLHGRLSRDRLAELTTGWQG
ncbi:MAG TPA: NAD(P)H-dependent oxidoreductase subunit E [Candidatus Lustribacter sp.]|nr:NAD(P)H-dependent oxidoreductase subunit E [Candidatus Lustribacter sp.]